jgi:hypothetical protein
MQGSTAAIQTAFIERADISTRAAVRLAVFHAPGLDSTPNLPCRSQRRRSISSTWHRDRSIVDDGTHRLRGARY